MNKVYIGRVSFINYIGNLFEFRNFFVYVNESRTADPEAVQDISYYQSVERQYYIMQLVLTPEAAGNLVFDYRVSDIFDFYDKEGKFYRTEYTTQYRIKEGDLTFILGVIFSSLYYRGKNLVRRAFEEQIPLNAFSIYVQIYLLN